MTDKVRIEKVDIRIGDKTVPLTMEQLRELKQALDQLFPAPAPVIVGQPYPVYVPRWPMYDPWPHWRGTHWTSTLSDVTGGSGTLMLSCANG